MVRQLMDALTFQLKDILGLAECSLGLVPCISLPFLLSTRLFYGASTPGLPRHAAITYFESIPPSQHFTHT